MKEAHENINIERQEKPSVRRVILEIGAGGGFFYHDVGNNFSPNDLYLALDLSSRVKGSKEQAKAFLKSEAVIADGQRLPLKDNSADEIYLTDVLNAPLEEYKYTQGGTTRFMGEDVAKLYKTSTDKINTAAFEDRDSVKYSLIAQSIIEEALRVLKDSGKLILVEKTDVAHKVAYSNLLAKLMSSSGFKYSSRFIEQPVANELNVEIAVREFVKEPSGGVN